MISFKIYSKSFYKLAHVKPCEPICQIKDQMLTPASLRNVLEENLFIVKNFCLYSVIIRASNRCLGQLHWIRLLDI